MRDSNVNCNVLHKTCTLVVLLCVLHIFVTVVYYVRTLDFRQTIVQQTFLIQRKLKEEINVPGEEVNDSVSVLDSNLTGTVKERCPDPSPLLGRTCPRVFLSSSDLFHYWIWDFNSCHSYWDFYSGTDSDEDVDLSFISLDRFCLYSFTVK